jgi:hypothetical protein
MSTAQLRKYVPQGNPATVKVETGFDGFVICEQIRVPGGPPPPLPPHYGTTEPWYKRMVTSHGAQAVFTPQSPSWFIVDFRSGFQPTNENIFIYAQEYFKSQGGKVPEGAHCPVVT